MIFDVICHKTHLSIRNFNFVTPLTVRLCPQCDKPKIFLSRVNSNQIDRSAVSQFSKILMYFRDRGDRNWLLLEPVSSSIIKIENFLYQIHSLEEKLISMHYKTYLPVWNLKIDLLSGSHSLPRTKIFSSRVFSLEVIK